MSRPASVLVASVAATVVVLGLSACGSNNYKTKTLNFTEKDTNYFGFNDAPPTTKLGAEGPKKLSPGDILAFSSDILDSSKTKVGELNASCVTTRPGSFSTATEQCSGSATVPGGTL